DPDSEEEALSVLDSSEITIKWRGRNCFAWLNGRDVSGEIRTPEVSDYASRLSVHPGVRRRLVQLQRELAGKGIVAEGRDAGTVIFPDADFKVYLDASLRERARRRLLDYKRAGISRNIEEVIMETEARDKRDSERKDSPLRIPDGAFVLRSDDEPIEKQVETIIRELERKLGRFHRDRLLWRVCWIISWPFWYLIWGMKVEGRQNIPGGPCIIAPNHTTMWDPPMVGAAAKRELYYLAKEDIFVWWLSWLIRTFNALKIKRSAGAKGAFEEAIAVLRKGGAVVMYPEGTRNRTQNPLLSFRMGPALLSQLSGAPIVPCYSTRHKTPWRPLRWLMRKPRLVYRFGEALWPQSYPPGRNGMVEMTKDLRAEILKLGGFKDED
ncbi:MAG: (d)CMP kinase, partial [Candidatus Hydrothermia bacterium]